MEEISLEGIDGFVKIKIPEGYGFSEEKNYLGHYGIKAEVTIKSQNYLVNGKIWTDTGEISNLLKELENSQINLKGRIKFAPFESDLVLEINYLDLGHIKIAGRYQERTDIETKLEFECQSNQSFIHQSLIELKQFLKKYRF